MGAEDPRETIRTEQETVRTDGDAATRTRDDAPAKPEAERRIGPYKILQEIGHGGMGTVYLAARADEQYQKRVAIKVIKAGMGGDEAVGRFRRERQILAGLDHPNIARLLDGGATDEGLPYLVMEHIEGRPLHDYCDSRRLPINDRLRIFQQVCSAVAHAHRNLIVHRDLKPSNILVTPEGVPRLLDFGIAKLLNPELSAEALTATGLAMTPEYASPEQARGEPITTASDVYSLGVILYELLTGQRPYRFRSRNPLEVLRAVIEEEPARPSTAVERMRVKAAVEPGTDEGEPITAVKVSQTREGTPARLQRKLQGDLDTIVMMALRKEPQRRYVSVEALSEDLRRYLEQRPVVARKGTAAYRAGKYVRRHAVSVTASAAFVLLLGVLAVTMTVQSARLARERDAAGRERDKAERVSAFLVDLFKVSDPGEARGNSVTAREILDRGAAGIAGQLKDQPDVKAALMDTMGRVYVALGLYDKARPLAEEALSLRRRALGRESLEVAASLQSVATVLAKKGDYPGAEALQREGLAIRRKLLGNEHADVAASLNSLAATLNNKGDYAGAELLHREALAMKRKVWGPEHAEVAITLNNLANTLDDKGDYAAAEALHREALAMRRKLLGSDHPDVAASLNNLAIIRYRLGDYSQAAGFLGDSLAIKRKVLGNEHPDIAASLHNLASVFYQQGDYAAAERHHREALAMKRKLLGNEHPDVASTLNNLGNTLYQEGKYDESEALLREGLAMNRKFLGAEHAEVARAMSNVADVMDRRGDHAAAEAMVREALSMKRELLGDDHPDVAESLAILGQSLSHQRRLAEAEKAAREALAMRRKAYGEGHPDVAASLIGLGQILTADGQAAQAEPMIREGVGIRQKSMPRDHPTVAEAQSALGECLVRQRKFEEAEPLLLGSYEVLVSKQRASVPARDARQHLQDLYKAWGKPDKAAAYRAEPPGSTR
jgi:serine/threonine-protein kinase